jgi:hypothetical protein
MIPFPYSPWPFLDFGQDPDPNGTPPTPNVPGVTIPWSALPPVAPPPPALPPVVPPPNIPPPQPTLPPSETPGFDKTFAPQSPPPPVAQPPRNPSLADILAPWIQPPEAEPPPPPALPPSETPGLDKAIARMNAPTPGFHLTPGLGGFTQRAADAAWSLPPPPVLLPMNVLAGLLPAPPPPMPAPSPLIRAANGPAAPTMPQPGIGPGIPETLGQMARRLMPYATEMGAAIGRSLPSVGAAGAGAVAAAPILLAPSNTQSVGTIDLGDGLRTNLPPGQRYVPIERRAAPGVFGTDVGATWKQVPGLYGEVDPGRGVLVDPDRLREALGDEAADRILNTPGIMPMAKPSSDKPPPSASGDNQVGKQPSLPPYQPPTDNLEPPPSGDPGNNGTGVAAAAGALASGLVEYAQSVEENSGRSIWSSTKSKTAPENAYEHWNDHKSEFPEYQNAVQYAQGAQRFVSTPPPGTLSTMRPNGDVVLYNSMTNTFAVKTADGVPRTMFRPDPAKHGYPTNMDYFNAQTR